MEPASYSFSRYLRAKRTVDDRALNRRVFTEFTTRLFARGRSHSSSLKLLELAGGIGHTTVRVLESLVNNGLSAVNYTLVDLDPELIAIARQQLSKWGRDEGFTVQSLDERIVFEGETGTLSVRLVAGDAFEVLAETSSSTYDAVITQAWLDLVNLDTVLERIFWVLSDEGLVYAPIHFDGETRFLPHDDAGLEEPILTRYHQSMDERHTPHGPAGGHRTGSRLLVEIPEAGGRIVMSGASDWIVRPTVEDCYPADEKYFLYHIVHIIEEELKNRSDIRSGPLKQWLSQRRSHIRRGELRYLAHQLDIVASKAR